MPGLIFFKKKKIVHIFLFCFEILKQKPLFKGQEKSAFVYVAGVVLLFDLVKNTFQCHLYKSAKKGSCYAWDGQAKGQSILKSLDAISLHKQDKG